MNSTSDLVQSSSTGRILSCFGYKSELTVFQQVEINEWNKRKCHLITKILVFSSVYSTVRLYSDKDNVKKGIFKCCKKVNNMLQVQLTPVHWEKLPR